MAKSFSVTDNIRKPRRPNLRWTAEAPNTDRDETEVLVLSRGGTEIARAVVYAGRSWWRWYAFPNEHCAVGYERDGSADTIEQAKQEIAKLVKRKNA